MSNWSCKWIYMPKCVENNVVKLTGRQLRGRETHKP
jgi:hypothetical protein